jgi:predicted alpha/beta-fold hydrolase
MNDFQPARFFGGGHLMTAAARLKRRRFARLPRAERRYFRVGDGSFVLAECNWQPDRHDRPLLLALHGLEGASDSSYMKGLAEKAFVAGFNVVRLNHRNCGGTEHLTRTLYHSGLTSDAADVIRELVQKDRVGQIALAGFSLGGNVALKLAGEYGTQPPGQLACVAAVSPPIDLTKADVLLSRRSNLVYQWYFLSSLKRRIRMKASIFPEVYSPGGLRSIRSMHHFDDRYTAPEAGFRDAADYYDRSGAINVIAGIHVPALIISARDDPFIPTAPYQDPRVRGNPYITLALTEHGGHCGFLSTPCAEHDGYWAEWKIVQFASEHVEGVRPGP